MSRPAFRVECRRPWLVARFDGPCAVLSWSANRPGFVAATKVACLDDPVAFLEARLTAAKLRGAVGLMTARDVRRHHFAGATVEDVAVEVLTTVGLTNGERVGQRAADPAAPARAPVGTINTLVHVSRRLTRGAMIEATSLATQARTLAVIEANVTREGVVVTGTGTDCIVLACPTVGDADPHAGLHTAVGEAIGRAVLEATREGIVAWLADAAAPDFWSGRP
mgnify:CR=1 FL=1